MRAIFIFVGLLPVGLFAGCASTPPPPPPNPAVQEHSVVGQKEGEQNRTAIDSSDQQLYNTEHAANGGPAQAPETPNTGIP